MLTQTQLNQLSTYTRTKLVSLFNPEEMFAEDDNFHKEMASPHRGFFIGVVNPNDEEVCRAGFLKEGQTNIKDSASIAIKGLFDELKSENITVDLVRKSTFHFSIITDCIFMSDPTIWNENTDGIYFMWGQRYRAMYLPYQVRRINLPKIDVMDRLCSWEAGVASNLWRLPEGLCFKLVCQSHTA